MSKNTNRDRDHGRIKVAAVDYLNTASLLFGLDGCAEIELTRCVPSKLADLLASGEADIALVSLIDAARSETPFALLPVGMIASETRTYTVRIFSKVPPEQITTLHADTDSHTSVALAQILLQSISSADLTVVDWNAREHFARDADPHPESILLIGDKVVTDSPPAVRYPHQLDLGAEWRRQTDLPFVYAVWMCRAQDLDDQSKLERVRLAADLLDRQRRRNHHRLDHLTKLAADQRGWPADLAREYLSSFLRFDVDEPAKVAAQTFLDRAAELGLAPRTSLRWA